MLIEFAKMHSLGNDFVVVDLITQYARLQAAHIKRIANRHLGIGCDQVLLLAPPRLPDADFYYQVFNADGHEVEQCGNGVRCLGRFLFDQQLTHKKTLLMECLGGKVKLSAKNRYQISAQFGVPQLETPFEKKLTVDEKTKTLYGVSTGNPHAVMLVENIKKTPVTQWGKHLSTHEAFPMGANIGFMKIDSKDKIQLRVYERGVGETLACGSGACAAVAVGQALDKLEDTVTVAFQQGDLQVEKQKDNTLITTGPTARIFMGQFRV